MGQAKRRKQLDPNFGKPSPTTFIKHDTTPYELWTLNDLLSSLGEAVSRGCESWFCLAPSKAGYDNLCKLIQEAEQSGIAAPPIKIYLGYGNDADPAA